MKTSTAGLVALIGREAIVPSRYKDSVGVWTIGVGHTKAAGGIDPATFAGELTMAQVLDLLRADIVRYENDVNRAVTVALAQHEFDALVSFHFNTGGIGRASLTRSLNAGDRKTAGAQFMNWVTPREITARRDGERIQFLTGKYPAPTAMVYPASPAGAVLWSKGQRLDVAALLAADTPDDPMPPDATVERVRWLQTRLLAHGFGPGPIDGDRGPRTNDALAAFVLAKHIVEDIIDANTAAALAAEPS